jgi:hypothetical protein
LIAASVWTTAIEIDPRVRLLLPLTEVELERRVTLARRLLLLVALRARPTRRSGSNG